MSGNRPEARLESALAECARLREENDRLRRILKEHNVPLPELLGITRNIHLGKPVAASATVDHRSNSDLKIGLFRSLFRGREDVYAMRWESSNGRHGYMPKADRDWKAYL